MRRGITVLARSLLRFKQFDLRALPVGEQTGALRSQLAAWQPFVQAEYFIQLQAGIAQVFACTSDTLEGLGARQRCWPESTLHLPLDAGVRLVCVLEGFEAQLWANGALKASRWWPEMPHESDWLAFVRAAGIPGEAPAMPVAAPVPWLMPRPAPVSLELLGKTQVGALHGLTAVLLLILVAMTGFAAHAYHAARESASAQDAELAALRVQTQPVLAARTLALDLQTKLTETLAPLSAPQPVEVLDHLHRVLPQGVVLREFDLQGLEVRVFLEVPAQLARSQLIEALEAGGWLGGVAEQPGTRGGVAIQMKLKGARSPDATLGDLGVRSKSSDPDAPAPARAPSSGAKP